ncbi:MAG TPA: hypothetical protein VF401_03255 [Candidatus Saccharimonadales bacterium]
MISVNRAAQRSLDALHNPDTQKQRHAEITAVHSAAKRAGLLAMDAVVRHHPEAVASLFRLRYRSPDLIECGVGANSIVYKHTDSNTVLKIARKTEQLSRRERQYTASKMQYEHDGMLKYLASFMLPQEISIGRHPINRDQSAIRIEQPYKQIIDPLLFYANIMSVRKDRLAAMQTQYPQAAAKLPDFVSASRGMYDDPELRLIGDTNGRANLVINADDPEELLMIDGQPVGPRYPDVQVIVLGQHRRLSEALAA